MLGGLAQGLAGGIQNSRQRQQQQQQLDLEKQKMAIQQDQFSQNQELQNKQFGLETQKFDQNKVEFEQKKRMDEVASMYTKAMTTQIAKTVEAKDLEQTNKMLASVKYSSDPKTAYETILVPYLRDNPNVDKSIKGMFPEQYDKKAEALVTWSMGMTGDALQQQALQAKNNTQVQVNLPAGYVPLDPKDITKGVTPIPGGPADKMSGESAKLAGIAELGLKAMSNIKDVSSNANFVQAAVLPNFAQTEDAQKLQLFINQSTEAIGRLHSGGAIGKEELPKFEALTPKLGDKPEVINFKIDALNKEFGTIKERMLGSVAANKGEETKASTDTKAVEYSIEDIMSKAKANGVEPKAAMKKAFELEKSGQIVIKR
jgi:hypothetical protein